MLAPLSQRHDDSSYSSYCLLRARAVCCSLSSASRLLVIDGWTGCWHTHIQDRALTLLSIFTCHCSRTCYPLACCDVCCLAGARNMGRIHKVYLPGNRIYSCGNCHAHLTNHEALISTSFQGRTGRAYLFDKVVNISFGPLEDRLMNTGMHTVMLWYSKLLLKRSFIPKGSRHLL